MTLGNWDPDADKAKSALTLDRALLQSLLALGLPDSLEQLENALSGEQKQVYAGLMRLDKDIWMRQADELSNEDIEQLMRFFTKAEQLPGWEAGPQSPVIWLGKVLKQRGHGLSRELTLWIKANSDNRFLPHGPIL